MTLKKLLPIFASLIMAMHMSGRSQATAGQQKQEQNTTLKSLITSRQYLFTALSATTKKGKTVQLSGGYGLTLNGDSLEVELPYYGRAYSTDYPPSSDNGIHIKSADFSYVADTLKKGGWDITIKPKNTTVNSIYLSVSTSGYCTTRIISSNKDPISYYGTITGNTHR